MSGSERYATVTNYGALYGTGYFAHGADSASFAKDVVPRVVADLCNSLGVNAVVDVGAGNGVFGNLLKINGIKCVDIDVTQRNDEDFIYFDISQKNQNDVLDVAKTCEGRFPEGYLVTSFDMAEHVDLEHLPDFLYNLAELIQCDAIISISTRPSSRANIYHSSVIPIDTWKYMFSLVGLQAAPFEVLQKHRSDQQFRSDTQELQAVSIWQKRNIFQDDASHQHYLRLTRLTGVLPTRHDIRNRMESVLDISTRTAKRELLLGCDMPKLTYLLNFVQDWSFLRCFLEVWPADRVKVIIRVDFIARSYAEVIEAYLTRVGVVYRRAETINQAADALDDWGGGLGDLFLTATEGLPTVLHGIASLITLDARKRGMTTVTLQHGDLVPEKTVHAAQFFIAMNDKSVYDFESSITPPATCVPKALGSPKQLDSNIVSADPDAIAFRLRTSAKHYSKRLLVGTNLHWLAHEGKENSVANWLEISARDHPDILFILRPHPDDWRVLDEDMFANSHNIMLLDEMTLLCIDWPISRVLSAVDGIISTHSTLILDALVTGKPTALFPTGVSDPRLLEVQQEWRKMGAALLSKQEFDEGKLPSRFFESSNFTFNDARDDFRNLFTGIVELVQQNDDPIALDKAIFEVEKSFLQSCRDLSLDSHPHANRQAVSSRLGVFACQ